MKLTSIFEQLENEGASNGLALTSPIQTKHNPSVNESGTLDQQDSYPGSADVDVLDSKWDAQNKRNFNDKFQHMIDTRRSQQPSRKHLGSGLFSYVDQDQSPHEMDNVSRIHSDPNDGGLLWYSIIANNPMLASNPYFPRVKSKTNSGGYPEFVVEKLHSLEVFRGNSEVLRFMLEQALGSYPGPEHIPEVTIAKFVNTIREYVVMGLDDPEASPQFQQVVDLLQDIVNGEGNYAFDIHTGNLMVRITGSAPQLVVGDPLTYYRRRAK